ncbi:MAG TPA: hypothetical protein VHX88_01200 [Solirubrobacteraceae bacterium]|jgi:hypothetical protein|nr:hypothetical protein [Solirubrobacteraceae bacterium]
MITGQRTRRAALAAAALSAAAAPGLALAAAPTKGGTYIGSQVEIAVAANGKSLTMVGTGYCARKDDGWSVHKVAIHKGTFSFSGSTAAPVHAHAAITGTFNGGSDVSGTVKVGDCAKQRYTAAPSQGGQG